jgi:glycine/serine hydroxymethyltransferase
LSGIPDPVTGVEALVDPSQVVTNLQAAAALGKRNVTFASQTIAGEPSTCATITSGRTGTYCVTDQGVLASATGANGSVTLTAFTTTVPASDFSPPAGATVETIP